MGVTNNNKTKKTERIKTSSGLGFKKVKILGLGLVLINCLCFFEAKAVENTELVNIFLSDSGALVLETKDKKAIESFDLLRKSSKNYKLVLNDVELDDDLIENFNSSHPSFEIKQESIKESFFKKRENLIVEVECLDDCDADFEKLLGGLAYSLDFQRTTGDSGIQQGLAETQAASFASSLDLDIEDKDFKSPTIEPIISESKKVHLLQANKKSNFLFMLSRESSPVEEFINDLDDKLVKKIVSKKEFREANIAKADSASLSHIATKLSEEGDVELSASAYAKALEIDPSNLNAMLGLARTTSNEDEKLQYYLKALDDEALLSVGREWFDKGIDSGDERQIAQAMIGYQFAVLKSPTNPYYRYEYAQALEKSGYGHFEEASKRYLEAAVLAKKDFQAGDSKKEDILRKSTECLIKVLTIKGSPEKAVHYCNSYLSLGFKKFLDGRSIKGVMKEIGSNKNPFQA